jgi:hypothetical protein
MPSSKINRLLPLALVLLIALAAVLCANPFGNFAYDDNFAYSNIALHWANTGAMHYNGWNATGYLVQAPLGGLLVRAAGQEKWKSRLNAMQKEGSKGSTRGKFKRAGWDDAYLIRLLEMF